MVHGVSGSVMCLLYECVGTLNQVIVDFDLEYGIFSFVDREDLMNVFSPNKQVSQIADFFLVYGSLYGLTVVNDPSPQSFAKTCVELIEKRTELSNLL
jgi:hypothetical protein